MELFKVYNYIILYYKLSLYIFKQYISSVFKGKEPYTLSLNKKDWEYTRCRNACKKIQYPDYDGKLTFSKEDSLVYSNIQHRQGQKPHITILKDVIEKESYYRFGELERRLCPAEVYEFVKKDDNEGGDFELKLHCENCLHCKSVCVKALKDNILWKPPEGGSGPNYEMT